MKSDEGTVLYYGYGNGSFCFVALREGSTVVYPI